MGQRFLFARIAIGLMCIVFAHFLGRSFAKPQQPSKRGLRTSSWALRTLVAGAALLWPSGVDWLAAAVYGLAVVSAGLGYFLESRPKKIEEDLTKEMFPD